MKNIGIKFCGQCNPRIQLRKVFDKMVALDKENKYSFYKEETGEYDLVVVLCGCPNECAGIKRDIEKIYFHPELEESADTMALRVLEKLNLKKIEKK